MKTHWTDRDLERMVRGLRDVPTGDAFWKDRVWKGIEQGLPPGALRPSRGGWFRQSAFLRWGVAAAGLLVMWGGMNYRDRQADLEVAEYVEELSAPLETVGLEVEHAWAPEVFKASTEETNETEEPATYLEAVFKNV